MPALRRHFKRLTYGDDGGRVVVSGAPKMWHVRKIAAPYLDAQFTLRLDYGRRFERHNSVAPVISRPPSQ